MTVDFTKLHRKALKYLANETRKKSLEFQPGVFVEVDCPETQVNPKPLKALRDRNFLIQIYEVPNHPNVRRISVCRTEIDIDKKTWKDGMSWECLMAVKKAAGFELYDAVEVFPSSIDVVNVANMRHLWVYFEPSEAPGFIWRSR